MIIAIHTGEIADNVYWWLDLQSVHFKISIVTRCSLIVSYALVSAKKSSNKILLNVKKLTPSYLRLLIPFQA